MSSKAAEMNVRKAEGRKERGWAIRIGEEGGYYDMNGIGDWSLAACARTCAIFETREDAEEVIALHGLTDDHEVMLVPITRQTVVEVGTAELSAARQEP